MSLTANTSAPPLLELANVARDYRLPHRTILGRALRQRVLHGVSLSLEPSVSLGLIGESGAGKSTLARLMLALEKPDLGVIRFDGDDLARMRRRRRRAARRRMQMVFLDPQGSLDPRFTIARSICEPLAGLGAGLSRAEQSELVASGLAAVGLTAGDGVRSPHEFSGGERQRIAIARALITDPDLLVTDEQVSALDVSVRGQILNLIMEIRRRRAITIMLISQASPSFAMSPTASR